jgi:hypothetical protein
MKILNLDSFAQVKRQIVLKAVTHDVRETSVQQFIDNLKSAEELEAAGKAAPETLSAQVENSVKAICDSIPTVNPADLRVMPIEAIGAILKFIRGELDPETLATPGGEEAGAEKKI